MKKTILKWSLRVAPGLILLTALSAAVLYALNRPAFQVPATVTDDPDLPALTIDKYRFHLETAGGPSRPVLIGLHGGPGDDMESVRPLLHLSDKYFVILYDQRNSGLSERTEEPVTASSMYDDLTHIADHFAGTNGKVILVGHSWGAMLAAAWSVRHPDRVAALVLAEPGFLTDAAAQEFTEKSNGMQPSFTWPVLKAFVSTVFESFHVKEPDKYAAGDYLFLRLVTRPDLPIKDHPLRHYLCPGKELHIPDRRLGALVGKQLFESVKDPETGKIEFNPMNGYELFKGDTLFIASECNTLIGVEFQKKYHLSLFPDARFVEIKDAGHLMFTEAEDATLGAIRSFLSKSLPGKFDRLILQF